MKNKFLTLTAVIIGLTIALATQSFTPALTTQWGNSSTGMKNLAQFDGRDQNPLPEPNTYRCDADDEQVCIGSYEGTGTPSGPGDLTNTELGIFVEN
jgi:hypothetical protein